MKKLTNLLILGSIFLIIIGMIIFVVTLSINKWDFTTLHPTTISTNTYEITDDFTNITIDESECDLDIVYITEGVSVVKEVSNKLHIVKVKDDTLTIKEQDNRAWYEYLFDFADTEMTLYLNKNTFGNLTINSSTGDIKISNKFTFKSVNIESSTSDIEFNSKVLEDIKIYLSTGDIEISDVTASNIDLRVSTGEVEIENLSCVNELKINVSTGKTTLDNVTCKDFYSTGSTGKIFLNNVIISNNMDIKRNTGDVKLDKCDALNIFIETSTGDVKGTLLSNKIFNVETDTGDKRVPESMTGGKCNITTNTGDIIIEVLNK